MSQKRKLQQTQAEDMPVLKATAVAPDGEKKRSDADAKKGKGEDHGMSNKKAKH